MADFEPREEVAVPEDSAWIGSLATNIQVISFGGARGWLGLSGGSNDWTPHERVQNWLEPLLRSASTEAAPREAAANREWHSLKHSS
jgi:hypothetical protein